MPGRTEDRNWQQQVTPPRLPVNEVPTDPTQPYSPTNPPPHPPFEPNRDWAWREHY
jgi:hypothetical protein